MIGHLYLAQIAVCIFFVSSAYFLVDSKKWNLKKIFHLWGDMWLIYIVFAVVMKKIYPQITWMGFIQQFFPLTQNFHWFVTCYICLYMIHPLLNIVIYSLPRRSLARVVMVGFLVYSCIDLVLPGVQFFYNALIGTVIVYMIVAYVKQYGSSWINDEKTNLIVCVVNFILLFALIFVTNLVGLKVKALDGMMQHWCCFTNPLIIICALTLFNLFKRFSFHSRVINRLSSCSLLIYVIHENYLFRNYARPTYFEWVFQTFSYRHVLSWCLLLAVISYAASVMIAMFYQMTIQGKVHAITNGIANAVFKRIDQTIDWMDATQDKMEAKERSKKRLS